MQQYDDFCCYTIFFFFLHHLSPWYLISFYKFFFFLGRLARTCVGLFVHFKLLTISLVCHQSTHGRKRTLFSPNVNIAYQSYFLNWNACCPCWLWQCSSVTTLEAFGDIPVPICFAVEAPVSKETMYLHTILNGEILYGAHPTFYYSVPFLIYNHIFYTIVTWEFCYVRPSFV